MMRSFISLAALVVGLSPLAISTPLGLDERSSQSCQKTKVAVLGAGCTGIFAAQALHNASMNDFLIVEYNGEIGGRVKHTTFGQSPHNYTIELGANWVQGLVSKGGPENPIWRLAQKWKLKNLYEYDGIAGGMDGAVDYSDLFNTYNDKYATFEQDAGYILSQNLQDRSARTGFRLAGWNPRHDPPKQAVEWFNWDFEYAQTPVSIVPPSSWQEEQTSHEFGVINYYSDQNNYVFDTRGYNAFIQGEASTFLKPNDPRLLLNTIVTGITYSDTGVTIQTAKGGCIQADYAINTFSIGVLQSDTITFNPPLPQWKQTGIDSMSMATYTKIFLQFPPDKVFWDKSVQYFLYADPVERGYYPLFQSLDNPHFLPGSGILFVTVVQDQSYQVEQQPDSVTQSQVMAVLRDMFGADKVPDPIAFMYPRWSSVPWAYGSYSNWPPSYTLEMHENLRASVGRLWFAGEATSAEYFGFLQGAYFEGQAAGESIAKCINGNMTACNNDGHYATLHGTTPVSDLNPSNGWTVSSFLTYGF